MAAVQLPECARRHARGHVHQRYRPRVRLLVNSLFFGCDSAPTMPTTSKLIIDDDDNSHTEEKNSKTVIWQAKSYRRSAFYLSRFYCLEFFFGSWCPSSIKKQNTAINSQKNLPLNVVVSSPLNLNDIPVPPKGFHKVFFDSPNPLPIVGDGFLDPNIRACFMNIPGLCQAMHGSYVKQVFGPWPCDWSLLRPNHNPFPLGRINNHHNNEKN